MQMVFVNAGRWYIFHEWKKTVQVREFCFSSINLVQKYNYTINKRKNIFAYGGSSVKIESKDYIGGSEMEDFKKTPLWDNNLSIEERLDYLEQDSMEIVSQLQTKADARIYLRMIEDIKAKRKSLPEDAEPEELYSADYDNDEAPADEYESKLSSAIVVEVHDTPKIPEGFGKKKKKGKGTAGGEAAVTAQELDAEYFAFQEEQQKALEAQLNEDDEEEPAGDSLFGALKKLGFGGKKNK